jgi:hypothetical protein
VLDIAGWLVPKGAGRFGVLESKGFSIEEVTESKGFGTAKV